MNTPEHKTPTLEDIQRRNQSLANRLPQPINFTKDTTPQTVPGGKTWAPEQEDNAYDYDLAYAEANLKYYRNKAFLLILTVLGLAGILYSLIYLQHLTS